MAISKLLTIKKSLVTPEIELLVLLEPDWMTSLDDINPGDYIVQVWTWRPKVGQATQTLEALEEAKEIFESHGFLVDLWQHGLGSKYSFNFVMLSNSKEEQAKSLESLLTDEEWQKKQLDWFDKQKYGRLVDSYEMTSLD